MESLTKLWEWSLITEFAAFMVEKVLSFVKVVALKRVLDSGDGLLATLFSLPGMSLIQTKPCIVQILMLAVVVNGFGEELPRLGEMPGMNSLLDTLGHFRQNALFSFLFKLLFNLCQGKSFRTGFLR